MLTRSTISTCASKLHMSSEQLATDILDRILSFQVLVAWAGEGLSDPPRLSWWRTDMVDKSGGGYLLEELMPRTYPWASLEAAWWAAMQADRQKRLEMAKPDAVRTLFFWGFCIDEQLADRLRSHKYSQTNPGQMLALPLDVSSAFSSVGFEAAIRLESAPQYKVVSNGRQMVEPLPGGHDVCAARLAAALLPLTPEYPVPFYPVER